MVFLPLRALAHVLTPKIILFFSDCDKADGLFNSVMNVVPETFSSAVGHNDFSLSASAVPYIALIDYDEALSSLVITILIEYRCRSTERGQDEVFRRLRNSEQNPAARCERGWFLGTY